MYDAKASTGGLRVYEPDPDSDNPRRLMLVSELRAALQPRPRSRCTSSPRRGWTPATSSASRRSSGGTTPSSGPSRPTSSSRSPSAAA